MASDDNEQTSDDEASSGASSSHESLSPRVKRALAEARAKAEKAGPGTRRPSLPSDRGEAKPTNAGSRWLALIPVTAAILAFVLMMPRAVPPDDVPLPRVDAKALAAVRQDDKDRAAAASAKRLDGDLLLVGTALRKLNRGVAEGAYPDEITKARDALHDAAQATVVADQARGFDGLRSLRAVQLEAFLAEVARFESTGKVSDELTELGGGFVERMSAAGWIEQNRVVLDEDQRRVTYKLVWAATLGVDRVPGLALTLDEQRVLYTLYLTHPHAPEVERRSFENLRRAAITPEACQRAVAKEAVVVEQWRADKIRHLGEIDHEYPTAYALGVSYYRAGRFDLSTEQFRFWITQHPDGPLSLRARNHLKAAFASYGPS